MKIAKLNIDGYIGGADIMSLFSGEETFNLSSLKKFLASLEEDVTDIHVSINSGGGSVIDGWAIYDKLKTSGYNITTIGEGIVGSIATIIYMAGTTRKLHENTKFFIHNPYWQPDAPTPMGAEDLAKLSNELKYEEDKILNFYVAQTGSELSIIEPLMKASTDLTSEQAIELGFAHSIITESIAARKYQLVACIENKQTKTKQMEKTIVDEIKNGFNKMAAMFRKATFKNMEIKVVDKEGAEGTLFVESETEDLSGKNAFLIDAEGNQTVAPDGDYTDVDGKVIVVAGGVVSEVKEMEAEKTEETIEDLKAKLAAALSENETLKASVQASATEKETLEANLTEIKTEFVALKETIIGAGVSFEGGKQNFKDDKNIVSANPFMDDIANNFKKRK